MKETRAIQVGAKAYLSRQFRTVGIFLAIIGVGLFFVLPAPENAAHSELSIKFGRSLAFVLGAAFSAITGYAGCGSRSARTCGPRTPRANPVSAGR